MSLAAIASRDFSYKTIRALARRGVDVVGVQDLPGEGAMPWANPVRGYVVSDRGTAKVWTFRQILEAAK